MKYLIFIAAFFSISQAYGSEKTFEYRASRYPVHSEDCMAASAALGTRFEQITGRRVLKTSCEVQGLGAIDLVVTYGGETPLNLVSTFDEYATNQGFFSTLETCKANIPLEVTKFEEYSGLNSVVAYCYHFTNSGGNSPDPYTLRIDGFGTAKLRPVLVSQPIYATPVENIQVLADKIKRAAEMEGFVWPRVAVNYSEAQHELILKYYAPNTQPIRLVQYTSYPTPIECARRLSEVEAIFRTVESVPMTTFCARKHFSEVTDLYALLHVKGSFQKTILQSRYSTMDECDADKKRISDWLKNSQGLNVVGTLCSYQEYDVLNAAGVFMHIFSKP